MSYVALAAVFLAVAAVVTVVSRRVTGRPSVRPLLWTMAVLALMTVVADNAMIAARLFGYGEDQLLGVYLGLMPVEDLSYPLAATLLLPALWHLLGRRSGRRATPSTRDARVPDPTRHRGAR